MEPSGIMDNNCYNKVCDVSEEEVHFSRNDMLNYKYNINNNNNNSYQQQRSFSITIDPINPAIFLNGHQNKNNFIDVNLSSTNGMNNNNNNKMNCYDNKQDFMSNGNLSSSVDTLSSSSLNYYDDFEFNQSERIKSNRILNSIGSKLRRGSNYLIAPKLVGQYLLGITIQNWSEFLNTSNMLKAPHNTQQLTRRLINNLNYFQGNYLCVSLILIIYCILTSPLLLLAIICYILSLYFITTRSATGKPIKIFNFKPNLKKQYSFITLISIPLLWVAGAPSAVFWVIGASFVVVGLHASMYNNDINRNPLNQNDQQTLENNNHHNHLTLNNLNNYKSPAQYYNHYPTTHQYLSIPSGIPVVNGEQQKSTTNSYANVLTQWITFGGLSKQGGHHHKLINQDSLSDNKRGHLSTNNNNQQRTPDVMIISQDYAGLGRVYEV